MDIRLVELNRRATHRPICLHVGTGKHHMTIEICPGWRSTCGDYHNNIVSVATLLLYRFTLRISSHLHPQILRSSDLIHFWVDGQESPYANVRNSDFYELFAIVSLGIAAYNGAIGYSNFKQIVLNES